MRSASSGLSAREVPSLPLDGLLEQIEPMASLRRFAEALNRSEAYLASAQHLTQTGSWAILPGAERASYWSEETFRIYECSCSGGPLSPDQLLELVHPADRDHYLRVVGDGLQSNGDWSAEFRIVLPSGRTKHLHAVGHPIFDEEENVREWVGAIVDVSQRRTAEEALERSQGELRSAVETIPAMAWTANPDGTNAFVSKQWADYGLPPGQTMITAWEDIVHPDDLARSGTNWMRCVETGDPFEEELRLRRASDGRYRWFLDRGVAIRGEDGAILKWYGVATDIDDRKQAEALLSVEKGLLRMIATGLPLVEVLTEICVAIEALRRSARASVLMLDADGTHLTLVAGPSVPEDVARQMVNIPIGPNTGPCGIAVHTRSPVIVPDVAVDAYWQTPMPRAHAVRLGIRASWSTPIVSPKGDVVGTVGIYCSEPGGPSAYDSELVGLATYIAGLAIDRSRSEQALRRSEAYLAEAERLAHTGSWVREAVTGRWIYWSAETFRIFGLDPARGAPPHVSEFFELIHPDDRERAQTAIAAAAVDRRDYEVHYRILLYDGTVKHIHDIGHPIANDNGVIAEWVGTIVDETERKLAEQERERVQRIEIEREAAITQERSRLAREIHDTLAQGLAMIVMQVADAEAKLGHAWSLAEKPLSTVRELAVESLAYARRSVNTLRPRTATADLSVTLQEAVNKLQRHFEGSLTLSVAGSPVRIDPAIEAALAGIANEALTNAVKHSKAMRIAAELSFGDSGAVRIVVTDDGIGFDAKDVRADAYGLVSMQEQATRARVALTFVAEPGAGTTIVASWSPDVVSGSYRAGVA